MLFKSAILKKFNKRLEIIDLEKPKLKKGQVLIKMIYSSICQSQLHEMTGGRDNKKWLPHLLGHEGVGKVLEIGKGVTKIKINDVVILTWIKTDGIECDKVVYKSKLIKNINAGKVTTFNQYAVVSENRIIKKNRTILNKHAPLFGCAFPTGVGLILSQKIKKNCKVVLIGLGGIGFFALLTLKYLGVKNITIIDNNVNKLNIAKKIGNYKCYLNSEKPIHNISKIIKNRDYDFCFESAGLSKTIELGFSLISNKGKCIFASHPNKDSFLKINPHELISGKKIEGVWGSHYEIKKIMQVMIKIYKSEIKVINNIFNDVYEFKNINLAIEDFKLSKSFRPIIKF